MMLGAHSNPVINLRGDEGDAILMVSKMTKMQNKCTNKCINVVKLPVPSPSHSLTVLCIDKVMVLSVVLNNHTRF